MNLLADASLPGLREAFPFPFNLTLYHHKDEISQKLTNQDILLCRANLKVNEALIASHQLQYVATASSGSDNLDYKYFKLKNITALDAKGCNALAVADYVLSTIACLNTLNLIKGKTVGVIGLGQVGAKVFKRLKNAGFKLLAYDPLKALTDHSFTSCTQEQLYECDVVCIHAQLHSNEPYPSVNLINDKLLNKLKPRCVLINASRGGIVDEKALIKKLMHAPSPELIYCTDVFYDEPKINKEIVNCATLCTPHIAGHSLEAKYKAVSIISDKLHSHLGLPLPVFAFPPKPPSIKSDSFHDWQELALSLYNPLIETTYLKRVAHLEQSFLELRAKHNYRHDFIEYFDHLPLRFKRVLL